MATARQSTSGPERERRFAYLIHLHAFPDKVGSKRRTNWVVNFTLKNAYQETGDGRCDGWFERMPVMHAKNAKDHRCYQVLVRL